MRLWGHNSFFAEDQFNGRLWHQVVDVIRKTGTSCVCVLYEEFRADFRLAPKHWETSLQCNAVSHWFGANLESALRFRTWASLRGAHVCEEPLCVMGVIRGLCVTIARASKLNSIVHQWRHVREACEVVCSAWQRIPHWNGGLHPSLRWWPAQWCANRN